MMAPECAHRGDLGGPSQESLKGRACYVWWLAGRRVTLQTRYFLFICPQCVISTFRPGDTEHRHQRLGCPDLSASTASRESVFIGMWL